MSLPDYTDPPPSDDLLAVLRVPLFLIVLGGLFLIEDYGGPAVSQTWPALLILWGAFMALAWRRAQ